MTRMHDLAGCGPQRLSLSPAVMVWLRRIQR
jgi:hypothetical protein